MSGTAGSSKLPSNQNTLGSKEAGDEKDPKLVGALEEDDEFEDFPVENWGQEETEAPNNTNLWEESWDDDDTAEDFSAQLKEEIKKVEAKKQSSSQ
ncbi:hypothetical protein K3495_g225 [Podosphaera aphanis]|nr:hypothetical protein K3495_g225 [Podosphaera aphanis]